MNDNVNKYHTRKTETEKRNAINDDENGTRKRKRETEDANEQRERKMETGTETGNAN